MTVFTPDFAAVDAGFPMYDKGMYRVKITSRAPSIWEKDEEINGVKTGNKTQVSRIRCKLEMIGLIGEDEDGDETIFTEIDGKDIRGKAVQAMDIYLHSQGAWSMAKQFVMGALGFAKNEENDFNEFFQEHKEDFVFSGDPGDSDELLESNLGAAWGWMVDRQVDVFLTKVTETYEGVDRENQKMSAWTPVGGRVEV